ncbi:helix-turn-helix domain-containing protein [Microbulbifer celer]|uniref:Helix-turn-helix domain-containing protein n=1 Tax=Microbulbifer celer TaxID=435905 RepID=A0ABW3UB91_9GAMM|nr:helix-turn-helix domain-containing protein [Microbulbifer celer]UFN55804.1 helix-turn-helix domain-containing protein [Microbulbifer celer]
MDILLFNIHDVVLFMTSYQCLLFALLLLVLRRERRTSNLLLAAFLLTQAMIPMDTLISYGAGFRQWAVQTVPNLFYVFGSAYWLEGPVLLWYTRSLIYRDYRLRRGDLLFMVPVLLYAVYAYSVYFRFGETTRVGMLQDYSLLGESLITHSLGFTREILRFAFGVWCLLEVRNARRQLRDSYSNIEKIDFTWLQVLIVGFLVIRGWAVFLNLAIMASVHLGMDVDYRIMGLTSNYVVFLLISAMIFFSLSYSSMFEGVERRAPQGTGHPGAEHESGDKREEQIRVAVDSAIAAKIASYMLKEKPFLEPSLTLEQLSSRLDLPRRTVSNTINRHFKRNFFEFVNYYRIEEAKGKLTAPASAHQTIMEIMLACGFNTKATFNSFFKKLVGMTPSEYRRRAVTGKVEEAAVSVQN